MTTSCGGIDAVSKDGGGDAARECQVGATTMLTVVPLACGDAGVTSCAYCEAHDTSDPSATGYTLIGPCQLKETRCVQGCGQCQ